MTGQWAWVHYPPSPTDAAPLIARLRACGCGGVLVKYNEGNSPTDNTSYDYQAAFRALAPQLVAAGIQVAAWGYVYPGDRLGTLVAAAAKDGAAFYVLDIEGEFDSPTGATDAQAILTDIAAAAPGVHLGYAPFPYADLHPLYPYEALDAACKICMPQTYWRDLGTTPGGAYNRCWVSMSARGLIGPGHAAWQPIGQTDNGATSDDVQAFATICRHNGADPISGISWWVLDSQPTEIDAALATTAYATPKAPSAPPLPAADWRARALAAEARVAAVIKALGG